MEVKYERIENIINVEPRILYIKKQLENLLRIVDLENNGKVVKIDGFRLKNISMWHNSMPANILSTLGTFSSKCDCNCDFCYEKGLLTIKEKLVLFPKRSMLTLREAITRARLYDYENRTGMFVPTVDSMEPTTNPNWIEILKIAREKSPNELLDLSSTNGSNLTESTIKRLAELKPIQLSVSLLSANPSIRKEIMKDPNPQTAINSIPLLRKYGIQFRVTIVAWPTIPFEDITKTIEYVDRYEPLEIQIQLPGYSKYGFNSPPFDTEKVWNKVVNLVKSLRPNVKAPLYTSPYTYEVNSEVSPVVVGVVKNSPASSAGIKIGDRILEIDGEKVFTRSYCNELLRAPRKNKKKIIKIKRGEEILRLVLDSSPVEKKTDLYPYKPVDYNVDLYLHYGVFLPDSFRLSYFNELDKICKRHNAKSVLVLASKLMCPFIKAVLPVFKKHGYFQGINVQLEVPENKFWGGNICLGDLLTVNDYISCIKEFVEKNSERPDLVVIPSSGFSEWGRDITGDSFLEIGRKLDITIELIHCAIIWR